MRCSIQQVLSHCILSCCSCFSLSPSLSLSLSLTHSLTLILARSVHRSVHQRCLRVFLPACIIPSLSFSSSLTETLFIHIHTHTRDHIHTHTHTHVFTQRTRHTLSASSGLTSVQHLLHTQHPGWMY
ncbi:hypothetical protein MHYP_G00165820 [Metynnis hypsauchen]